MEVMFTDSNSLYLVNPMADVPGFEPGFPA
jgi:hypothetical protein